MYDWRTTDSVALLIFRLNCERWLKASLVQCFHRNAAFVRCESHCTIISILSYNILFFILLLFHVSFCCFWNKKSPMTKMVKTSLSLLFNLYLPSASWYLYGQGSNDRDLFSFNENLVSQLHICTICQDIFALILKQTFRSCT